VRAKSDGKIGVAPPRQACCARGACLPPRLDVRRGVSCSSWRGRRRDLSNWGGGCELERHRQTARCRTYDLLISIHWYAHCCPTQNFQLNTLTATLPRVPWQGYFAITCTKSILSASQRWRGFGGPARRDSTFATTHGVCGWQRRLQRAVLVVQSWTTCTVVLYTPLHTSSVLVCFREIR
jgi:hypothetical protein